MIETLKLRGEATLIILVVDFFPVRYSSRDSVTETFIRGDLARALEGLRSDCVKGRVLKTKIYCRIDPSGDELAGSLSRRGTSWRGADLSRGRAGTGEGLSGEGIGKGTISEWTRWREYVFPGGGDGVGARF